MPLKIFHRLAAPRDVNRLEFPADLAEFYASNEGIGLECDWVQYPVRLCKLSEVERVDWDGLGEVADVPEGWERFDALLIGYGCYAEKITYILNAPSCPPGSVLAIGGNIGGSLGGTGPYALESSFVLAATFKDWLAHLERWDWVEYALTGFGDLPESEWIELFRYYAKLNPSIVL